MTRQQLTSYSVMTTESAVSKNKSKIRLSTCRAIRQEKEMKSIQIGKEKVQ